MATVAEVPRLSMASKAPLTVTEVNVMAGEAQSSSLNNADPAEEEEEAMVAAVTESKQPEVPEQVDPARYKMPPSCKSPLVTRPLI